MAKAKFISDFERDVIRVGVARGLKHAEIARFLGRGRNTIHYHIKAMRADGTIDDLPFCFVRDEIEGSIRVENRK